MSKFVLQANGLDDQVFDTHAEAEKAAWLSHDPFWVIRCAPDQNVEWRTGHGYGKCWVLYHGIPVWAKWMPIGTAGIYELIGLGKKLVSVHKTDGWLPEDWFMFYPADNDDMRRFQVNTEYAD